MQQEAHHKCANKESEQDQKPIQNRSLSTPDSLCEKLLNLKL